MRYLATITYVGTDFCGFQVQPNVRTVQGTLTEACTALFGSPCQVQGCSRTDSGVHAVASRVLIETDETAPAIPPERLALAIAPYLPWDLSLMEAVAVSPTFHIRHDVQKKQYVYLLRNAPVRDPLSMFRMWQFPYTMPDDALERMQKAASLLVGVHDFASFMAAGSPVPHTMRHLMLLEVQKEQGVYRFTLEADGFLYNMVRIIVGTLVDVAMHRLEPEDMVRILEAKDRKEAGETAPPEGLYLEKVIYQKEAL
ncbi:MAG: tRNA pseudouridine(38-40) synthase TruA [Clostridia bacterium]|nr:tRNA pseudouridine(38-40) synthase TruA [Clostridia bacterium]